MRNSVPILLAMGLLSACSKEPQVTHKGLAEQLPPATDLNVLVVSFDAMRADGMGLYGYHRDTTPNLDQFARDALVFDNAYSAAPVTPTSFAAAYTGQYPYRVFIGWQLLPATTLAGVMQDSGRDTFGLINNVQVAGERNFGQGFDHYEVANFTDRDLLKAVGARLREQGQDPFFGWVHFISPHTPYDYRPMTKHLAPRQDEGRFATSVPANYSVANDVELERARELYDGEMYFADHLFGQLLSMLEEQELLERTIIIVTSDHGEEFGDHGRVGHKSLYNEVVRIPLLIRHPAAGGSRTDIPYVNVDLLPTLAGMVGQPIPPDLDGLDLRGEIPNPRTRIVTGMSTNEHYQMAIESGGRKLIQVCTPEFSESMFDRNQDPGEQQDILLDQPGMATELTDLLERETQMDPCRLILNSVRGKAPEDLLSDEQIEQLKSLGYIQ
jgi:arylsulfatase